MAKKNGKKTSSTASWSVVRRVIIGITGLLLVGAAYQLTQYFFYHSPYFKVKKIVLSPTLSVIDKSELLSLQGRSLFGIDVRAFYDELNAKYPQISDLRVIKQFPDQIRITGLARLPFAQVNYKNKLMTIDSNGIVLDLSADRQKELFLIKGLQDVFPVPAVGVKMDHNNLASALEILKVFSQNPSLKGQKIIDVDAGNLSKIIIRFNRGPDVIIDWTEIPQKFQMLGVVRSQAQFDFEKIRYIDLRFKEPVIGRD